MVLWFFHAIGDYLLVAFVAVAVVTLTWICKKVITYCKFLNAIRKIPGRPTHWLLGNLHEVIYTLICNCRYQLGYHFVAVLFQRKDDDVPTQLAL